MSSDVDMVDAGVRIEDVDRIFHIADVHIRNLTRHDEYRQVFDRLYEHIDARYTRDSICVLAGDLAHAKTEMSPELIDMMSAFLTALAERMPTFVIPGNHDAALSNADRMDALTPVVNALQRSLSNLHFFRDSGVWRVGNLALTHLSQFDDPANFPRADQIPDGFVKVAMYHGTVNGSRTDTGFVLENESVSKQTFEGFDIGLLGDIHRRQPVDDAGRVMFPGSLVQQDHGESLDHGFLVWDVDSRTHEYVPVHNDYGFYTMDVRRGRVPLDERVPDKPRLRVRVSDTPPAEERRCMADIRQLYDVQELRVDPVGVDIETGESPLDVGDVRDSAHRADIICEHVERVYDADQGAVDAVREIDRALAERVQEEDGHRNAVWRLKRFEWSNMFSYGENNIVDFDKMRGVVGLFAENASGKSSLLDAISFCLFDRCERASKSADVMNNQADTFSCKAVFALDGGTYVVEREAVTQPNGHVPVDVDFYRVHDDGSTTSLNGGQRRETNKVIRRYIGEYDDFIATAFSVQGNNAVFVEKTQSQRKDLLAKFIGIDVFDTLHSLAKDDIRDVKAVLSDLDDRDLSSEMAEVEQRIESAEDAHVSAKSDRDSAQARVDELSERLNTLNRDLRDTPDRTLDIDALKKRESALVDEIDRLCQETADLRSDVENAESALEEAEERLSSMDADQIRADADAWSEAQRLRDKLERVRDQVRDRIEDRRAEAQRLRDREFDPDCTYCVERNQADADRLSTCEDELGRLQSKKDDVSSRLERVNRDLDTDADATPPERLSTLEQAREKADRRRGALRDRRATLAEKSARVSEAETALERVRGDIDLHARIQSDLKHNRQVQARIDDVERALGNAKSALRDAESHVQDAYSRLKVAERDRDSVSEALDRYRTLSEKAHAYSLYIDATNRDGVPYELIERTMPQIEGEVNDILACTASFSLSMELDDGDVDAYIVYDDDNRWPVELGSGMEKFVSGLAIRVGLINVSSLPRPNFVAIDEGFGVLDAENLNSLGMLFGYLKQQFKFCVIISHLGGMRDAVDDIIEITKAGDGRSGMRYV